MVLTVSLMVEGMDGRRYISSFRKIFAIVRGSLRRRPKLKVSKVGREASSTSTALKFFKSNRNKQNISFLRQRPTII
mgnify:CR=1 FL=1|jgi:hypothetical protein